ncbi:MAG: hypothetical protein SOX17_06825 [Prevotella sp.]|nr:hypothetical protein [Prevotella sp.]MDD7605829.1 hypothetical protein [Prevotellaceae bacterium]MDY3248190.1 hypothetical protein [Prevotella sp.]
MTKLTLIVGAVMVVALNLAKISFFIADFHYLRPKVFNGLRKNYQKLLLPLQKKY